MIAVALALLVYFPVARGITSELERFFIANLLPENSSTVVATHLGQFIHRAEVMPLIDMAVLVVTALDLSR